MKRIISLTTDFGTKDSYVAAMKGVILSINPDAVILDLTHEINPQNLIETNLFVLQACPYFPPGTIHVIVVDPGVGTARKPVIIQTENQYFVCPDNGLISLFLQKFDFQKIHEITNPAYMLKTISSTFHGRDIFSPAAAHLSLETPIESFGSKIDKPVTINVPSPKKNNKTIKGEIIHIDHFGNLITNIHTDLIPKALNYNIKAGNFTSRTIVSTYGETAPGTSICLIGSSGLFEISVNQGNASNKLGLSIGESVTIQIIE